MMEEEKFLKLEKSLKDFEDIRKKIKKKIKKKDIKFNNIQEFLILKSIHNVLNTTGYEQNFKERFINSVNLMRMTISASLKKKVNYDKDIARDIVDAVEVYHKSLVDFFEHSPDREVSLETFEIINNFLEEENEENFLEENISKEEYIKS